MNMNIGSTSRLGSRSARRTPSKPRNCGAITLETSMRSASPAASMSLRVANSATERMTTRLSAAGFRQYASLRTSTVWRA